MNYDAIIILGSHPDPKTWKFPDQIYQCLDEAATLLKSDIAPYVITSGKWTIGFDNANIHQPFYECEKLADYLMNHGAPAKKILQERDSKDTISNLYYLKTKILIPREMRHLIFVVASFRVPRLKFLVKRILGPEYLVEYKQIEAGAGSTYDERRIFEKQSEFLKPMKDGNHEWLSDKFYEAKIYQSPK